MYVKYVRKNLHLFVLTITGLMFVICVTRAQVKNPRSAQLVSEAVRYRNPFC